MPVFDELVEHFGRFRALRASEQVFLASVADRKQKKRRECLGMRILGGGEVACETAEMLMADARPNSFATTGSIGDVEVTLVEMQPQLMTGVCLPNRNIALASLRREGVKSYINSKVLEVTEHEVKIQHKDGTEEWLKGFDYIVLGLGSRKYDPLSEELKAFVPEVHVIGDAIKPGQSSDAMHQGFHVGYEL